MPTASAASQARSSRRFVEPLFGFCCIFVGLSLPLPGVATLYARAHTWLGNLLLPSSLSSGVELTFQSIDAGMRVQPWALTLLVQAPAPARLVTVPIDLRTLLFLPTVCFVALAVATPLSSKRRTLIVLGVGLLILEPLLLGLVATPVLSLLGGNGPVRAFDIGVAGHVALQVVYRALVASPGMAYAIPLFLWWILIVNLGRTRAAPEIQVATG
jgi:hypothetical protein